MHVCFRKADHPKLYMWAKNWEEESKQNRRSPKEIGEDGSRGMHFISTLPFSLVGKVVEPVTFSLLHIVHTFLPLI